MGLRLFSSSVGDFLWHNRNLCEHRYRYYRASDLQLQFNRHNKWANEPKLYRCAHAVFTHNVTNLVC